MKSASEKHIADCRVKPTRGHGPAVHTKSSAERVLEFGKRRKFNFLTSALRDQK